MPTVYLRRRDDNAVLTELTVGSASDPLLDKVLDGLNRLAWQYPVGSVWVDDSEVNPGRTRPRPAAQEAAPAGFDALDSRGDG